MALSREQVRIYTKDNPELNILLEGEEANSDAHIDLAMSFAASDFNAMTPMTSYIPDGFPNDSVLLYGTLHHLANMEAERQLRNQMNFNAQGIAVGIDDKFAVYNQLAGYYMQLFLEKAKILKAHLNNEAAWGTISSPYASINEYNFRN